MCSVLLHSVTSEQPHQDLSILQLTVYWLWGPFQILAILNMSFLLTGAGGGMCLIYSLERSAKRTVSIWANKLGSSAALTQMSRISVSMQLLCPENYRGETRFLGQTCVCSLSMIEVITYFVVTVLTTCPHARKTRVRTTDGQPHWSILGSVMGTHGTYVGCRQFSSSWMHCRQVVWAGHKGYQTLTAMSLTLARHLPVWSLANVRDGQKCSVPCFLQVSVMMSSSQKRKPNKGPCLCSLQLVDR